MAQARQTTDITALQSNISTLKETLDDMNKALLSLSKSKSEEERRVKEQKIVRIIQRLEATYELLNIKDNKEEEKDE